MCRPLPTLDGTVYADSLCASSPSEKKKGKVRMMTSLGETACAWKSATPVTSPMALLYIFYTADQCPYWLKWNPMPGGLNPRPGPSPARGIARRGYRHCLCDDTPAQQDGDEQ